MTYDLISILLVLNFLLNGLYNVLASFFLSLSAVLWWSEECLNLQQISFLQSTVLSFIQQLFGKQYFKLVI